MFVRPTQSPALLCFILLLSSTSAEGPPTIEPSDAKQNLDKTCTVKLFVRSAGKSKTGGMKYLNSEADFRSEKNLALLLEPEVQEKFAEKGIKDPVEDYYRKWLQVTGKIQRHKGRMQIKIDSPDQIKVLDLSVPPEKGPGRPSPPMTGTAPPGPAEEGPGAGPPLGWLPAALIGVSCLALGFVIGRFTSPSRQEYVGAVAKTD